MDEDLPPLPAPYHGFYAAPMYSADQMRAYARAALRADERHANAASLLAGFDRLILAAQMAGDQKEVDIIMEVRNRYCELLVSHCYKQIQLRALGEPPQVCPLCGGEWHAEDCEFGKEVALRLKAERNAHKLAHALESVAMMLRKCAHRLSCNGHEDLSADAVGLLRRLDLLGSPLRDVTPTTLSDEAPSNAARCEGCAELRDQLRDATQAQAGVVDLQREVARLKVENARLCTLSNVDAMRVGKLAEDVERYSALHARLFAEKTAAQIKLEGLREALFRLWPAVEKAMAGLVFTADRAGDVAADMSTIRAAIAPEEPAPGCKTPAGCSENGCLGWCDEHAPEAHADNQ